MKTKSKLNHDKPPSSPTKFFGSSPNTFKTSLNTPSYNKNPNKQPAINPKPNPYSKPSFAKCFKCNQTGYRFNEYPLGRFVNVIDDTKEMEKGFEDANNETLLGVEWSSLKENTWRSLPILFKEFYWPHRC